MENPQLNNATQTTNTYDQNIERPNLLSIGWAVLYFVPNRLLDYRDLSEIREREGTERTGFQQWLVACLGNKRHRRKKGSSNIEKPFPSPFFNTSSKRLGF
jgi:hypothetical protein